MQVLFLSLYKNFANVLLEPLREAYKDETLRSSDQADDMTIDLEGSSAMELDKENEKLKNRCFFFFHLMGVAI